MAYLEAKEIANNEQYCEKLLPKTAHDVRRKILIFD